MIGRGLGNARVVLVGYCPSIGKKTANASMHTDSGPHRLVDNSVLAAAITEVKTAIVCPSLIYGRGRGPGNQRSIQAYELSRLILERKKGFTIGREDYMWFNVHVYDLSRLYLSLLEAAVASGGLER